MEEKKIDINTIIGFVLIFGILIFMFYQNQPTQEEIEAKRAQQEKVEVQSKIRESLKDKEVAPVTINPNDSVALAGYKNAIGSFAYTPPSEETTVLENDLVYLRISNKGGQIVEARMKGYKTYDSIPVHIIKDGNATFGLTFNTTDNRVLHTKDMYFEPSLSEVGENQVLSMQAKVSPDQFWSIAMR